MKAIWLASWYPSKLSPFDGDFIQRHAEAASLYNDIHVIHVIKDLDGTVTKSVHHETSQRGRLKETIIYYHIKSKIPFIHRALSARRYKVLFENAVQKLIAEEGKPDIIHVHVGMKAGMIAKTYNQRFQIPYVVTEHWTGFLPEAINKFEHLSSYIKREWKSVVQHATAISFVSSHLKKAYSRFFDIHSSEIIPNVVNHEVFKYSPARSEIVFIHISGMDERKRPLEILEAFQVIHAKYPTSRLKMIGAMPDHLMSWVHEKKLQHAVEFIAEIDQKELANHLSGATASILYSSCETFGCVIIEANAAGVPVLVSNIPVFYETVKEGWNGFMAQANQPAALASKMEQVIQMRSSFDGKSVSETTLQQYGYSTIGASIADWYERVLNKR